MNAGDLRLVLALSAICCALMGVALVTLHQRHYSQRRLILLEDRVESLVKLVTEDKTL